MQIRGEATIERVQPTGVMVDQNPELEFELRVELPGGKPFLMSHRLVVSRQVRHNFAAGRAVSVTVDPSGALSIG